MATTTHDPTAHLDPATRVRFRVHAEDTTPIIDEDTIRRMVRSGRWGREEVQALANQAKLLRDECLAGGSAVHNGARWHLTHLAARRVLGEVGGPVVPAWLRRDAPVGAGR